MLSETIFFATENKKFYFFNLCNYLVLYISKFRGLPIYFGKVATLQATFI